MHDISTEMCWRMRCAIRDAAPCGGPDRMLGRLKPLHGSDVQDWIISLRPNYWAEAEHVLDDMCRRGMLRRLGRMLMSHQENAQRASGRSGAGEDSPLFYWYEAMPGPPCPWYRLPEASVR